MYYISCLKLTSKYPRNSPIMLYETHNNHVKTSGLPVSNKPSESIPRERAKSISFLPSSENKLRRRFSRIHTFDDCQIFTINENADLTVSKTEREPDLIGPAVEREVKSEIVPEKPKSGKRRSSRLSCKVPDISNFPLLVTSPDEIVAASRRKYSRAKSAPVFKVEQKSESKAGFYNFVKADNIIRCFGEKGVMP